MDRLAALLEFHRLDPDDAFTRFAIAREHLKSGNIEDGLAFFEDLVRDNPDYVGTYYHLGKLYLQLDRLNAATDVFRAGIDVATKKGDLHARAELQSALSDAEGLGVDE